MFYLITQVFNHFFYLFIFFLYSCVEIHKDEGIKVLNDYTKLSREQNHTTYIFLNRFMLTFMQEEINFSWLAVPHTGGSPRAILPFLLCLGNHLPHGFLKRSLLWSFTSTCTVAPLLLWRRCWYVDWQVSVSLGYKIKKRLVLQSTSKDK